MKEIGKAVSESSIFREHIKESSANNRKIWIDRPKDPLEMSGDLYYAIQHIRPVSLCIKTPRAIMGISWFSDCYDFEYRTKKEAPDFFKRTVNNECSYKIQENGYGTNYLIEVMFPLYIQTE